MKGANASAVSGDRMVEKGALAQMPELTNAGDTSSHRYEVDHRLAACALRSQYTVSCAGELVNKKSTYILLVPMADPNVFSASKVAEVLLYSTWTW